MIGLFVLIILGLWGLFAIWLGKFLSKKVFARFTTNQATGEISTVGNLITNLLIALVLVLPVADQLIAYPKWQQLCATTGDFEWGLGMNEKEAFGRAVNVKHENHQTTIFPNIRVNYSGWFVYDAQTKELIFKKPHYRFSARAFIYLPTSSGNKSALLLSKCSDYTLFRKSDDVFEKLELIVK